MPTSKKRGGTKTHAKKVQHRNKTIRGQKNSFQKIMNEQMEELKRKYTEAQAQSGMTENAEVVSQ
jgi:hypothetical protein